MTEQIGPIKGKSFWKRPEGKLGALFLIAGIAVIAVYHVPIFAFIQSLLAGTISTIALVAVVAALLYIILDKKVRNLAWYMYKGVMRWITKLFVQIDPIKILENYVEYLKKNMKKMNTHISKLKGQISQLKTTMVKNKREMDHSLKLAEQAKKQGKNELLTINTRQYGRLKESNARYSQLLGKMQILYKVLNKIYINSGYLIQDTDNDVRMRKQELKAIKTSHSAMKRAMNIIQGDPDKKMIFDMATETVVEEIHTKIGEMERFIELSGSFIDSIDLQNGVYEQEGLEILEKLEKEGNSFLFNEPKEKDLVKLEIEEKEIENLSDYSTLFE
ncbi:MAG: PspA/IM30 family protein [Bacteroidales bacterium]|nr:PspA/IM30 family protein [Bacteroidales bacterium]